MSVHKYVEKQTLIHTICMCYCPRDFGFETEYSLNNREKWCTDSYQGDCNKCWDSKVIERKRYEKTEKI